MNTLDTHIAELEAIRSNKSAVNQQIIEAHTFLNSITLTNPTPQQVPSHDHYDTDQEEDDISDEDTDTEN